MAQTQAGNAPVSPPQAYGYVPQQSQAPPPLPSQGYPQQQPQPNQGYPSAPPPNQGYPSAPPPNQVYPSSPPPGYVHPNAAGAQPEPKPSAEPDTTKYWGHFGAGFGIALIVGLFSLFGLFVVTEERKRKFYLIGCASGVAFCVILWIILYFAVFAAAASAYAV